jgi:hypothetical protein
MVSFVVCSRSQVKNNILFGQPYDHQRYQETIRVCALTRDLKVLPDGDLTEIGEKGSVETSAATST